MLIIGRDYTNLETVIMDFKECSQCLEILPNTQFKSREDNQGLYAWCNACRAEDGREELTEDQEAFISKTQIYFEEYPLCQGKQT